MAQTPLTGSITFYTSSYWIFTASGTTSTASIRIQCWGGGAMGSPGTSLVTGLGGMGGAYQEAVVSIPSSSLTYRIIVGEGGTPSSPNGGTSSFQSGSTGIYLVRAAGGYADGTPQTSQSLITGSLYGVAVNSSSFTMSLGGGGGFDFIGTYGNFNGSGGGASGISSSWAGANGSHELLSGREFGAPGGAGGPAMVSGSASLTIWGPYPLPSSGQGGAGAFYAAGSVLRNQVYNGAPGQVPGGGGGGGYFYPNLGAPGIGASGSVIVSW